MKVKLPLSVIVLLFFCIIAGGSLDDIGIYFAVVAGMVVCAVIGIGIYSVVQSSNEKKRNNLFLEEMTANTEGFNRSVYVGNDRLRVYSDVIQNKLLIVTTTTSELNKKYFDNFSFKKNSAACLDKCFYAFDSNSKNIIYGCVENNTMECSTKDISKYYTDIIEHRDSIEPKFITVNLLDNYFSYIIFIDESRGIFSRLCKNGGFTIHSYVDKSLLIDKVDKKTHISSKIIADYCFVMDDFFKVLIIFMNNKQHVINYSDILDIVYEENGRNMYSKSATRTIGGTLVGGALLGGAGAIVGGLSGSYKEKKIISNMDLRIILKGTSSSSIVLNFLPYGRIEIKDDNTAEQYKKCQSSVNMAKDLLSAIIDDVNRTVFEQNTTNTLSISVSDELMKLAKLKEDGILSDSEFQSQKKKLLGL